MFSCVPIFLNARLNIFFCVVCFFKGFECRSGFPVLIVTRSAIGLDQPVACSETVSSRFTIAIGVPPGMLRTSKHAFTHYYGARHRRHFSVPVIFFGFHFAPRRKFKQFKHLQTKQYISRSP